MYGTALSGSAMYNEVSQGILALENSKYTTIGKAWRRVAACG
jgi:hypothetical protein